MAAVKLGRAGFNFFPDTCTSSFPAVELGTFSKPFADVPLVVRNGCVLCQKLCRCAEDCNVCVMENDHGCSLEVYVMDCWKAAIKRNQWNTDMKIF